MAKSAVIKSSFESLFRLRQLYFSLITEEAVPPAPVSFDSTSFGLLVMLEEFRRFSDRALRVASA